MTSSAPIISIESLTFGYKRKNPVLEDISLQVPQGQSLAILGYNGVGKTTLMNLIVGLLKPQSGRAIINKALVPSMRDVFQMTEQANLVNTMTVRDNITFRKYLFESKQNDQSTHLDPKHLDEEPLVKAFDLIEHLDKKVSDLSSGLRKRAGIVAGMLFDPHVIMLDEPTNSIDPITRQLLIDYINQLRADGRTLLTITHDLEYCWDVADRIVILDNKHMAKDAMLSTFHDFEEFKRAATLGREKKNVDFGLKHTSAN
jgi:ABC-type multidrug transport system ATPase subunit